MSKISKVVKKKRTADIKKSVVNFMNGISYEFNPIDTLKMISASSIFGEPQYYRKGMVRDKKYMVDNLFAPYAMFTEYEGKTTTDIFTEAIDRALDYDFGETLNWAVELRNDFYMRINPQVIMVRAAIHPGRAEFTKNNPGLFAKINEKVMKRADEPSSQCSYYLYINGSKKRLPDILKKNWASRIERMTPYELSKYKNADIGLVDTIRICHANNENIDALMNGELKVTENDNTWERLRSEGKTWREILSQIKLGHMALIRNLRNIFTEIDDIEFCKKMMDELIAGVKTGKQFPFRYWTAMKMLRSAKNVNHLPIILDALERCIDESANNMPTLKGKTMCLSDNSGSAWGAIPSEYGHVKVAEIGNLSSTITAKNSDEGYVGVFGDELKVIPITKRDGILTQAEKVTEKGKTVGKGTENGVWSFFDRAIKNKEHWDNIFIYSDMQAGHGGLYGNSPKDYEAYKCNGSFIDVNKLIQEYRKVNPDVNVFCVQTAGYDNVLVPEYGYRTNLLYGWTGKELLFADNIIKLWDEIKNRKNQ